MTGRNQMKKRVFTFTLTYYNNAEDLELIASKLSDMVEVVRSGNLSNFTTSSLSEGLGYKITARNEASDEN